MKSIAEHNFWQGETPLLCVGRREETHDTASFELAASDGKPFDFLPGQFLPLGVEIDGQTHWRAYSIASSPAQSQRVTLAVKRVAGGCVSNWLLDTLQPGMPLPAMKPAGDFALPPDGVPSSLALFSSGCGITPMMSMTRWLLEKRPDVDIHFFHSARREDEFIFREQVLALAAAYPRFRLHLFLTQPQGKLPCHVGRLDHARLQALLPHATDIGAFICGPDGYMDDVEGWLIADGMPAEAVCRESFAPIVCETATDAPRFTFSAPAFGKTSEIAHGESLLVVMEREGLPIIAACRTGVCGSCKCKVVEGAVDFTNTGALHPEDVAAGYVLACSSTVKSDLAIELG